MAKDGTVKAEKADCTVFRVHYDMPFAERIFAIYFAKLIEFYEDKREEIVFLCIGTDMMLVDTLGPLTGEMLVNNCKELDVYGTLKEPVHACNFENIVAEIKNNYRNPLIVAVDAAVGKREEVGEIVIKNVPLRPGAATGKKLPEVGDISIIGIVNINDNPNKMLAYYTRLYIVYKMATIISNGIKKGLAIYSGNRFCCSECSKVVKLKWDEIIS